jgi:ribosomal protein S18 acetylase RimI-like enzyme
MLRKCWLIQSRFMKSFSAEQLSSVAPKIALRPVLPEDAQLLYEVYASTRADELAQVSWGEAQREAFLRMQLNARDRSYRMHYTEIDDRIILFNNQPVGRLIVVHTDEGIRLADIALLPEYRSAGIGTALVQDLIAEANRATRPVLLQVEKSNPQAKRFYERLGFAITGENSTHFQMQFRPGAS